MAKKMLVDASHPEETRVVVLDGNRVEEFDYESASRRPLKGNIYLAKVTRVEPSLQACFIEYGGNRHGFLAFSEIHPDYYQIPTADRQALLAANRAEQRHEDIDDEPAGETEQSQRVERSEDADASTENSQSSHVTL
ncbi:MAG: ribonuclease E/G, partial [Micropepsaceae bacterium]